MACDLSRCLLYPVYTTKLARRAGSTSARALDERSTSSFVNVCNITPFKWPDSKLIKPARRALVEPASSCKRGISLSGRQLYASHAAGSRSVTTVAPNLIPIDTIYVVDPPRSRFGLKTIIENNALQLISSPLFVYVSFCQTSAFSSTVHYCSVFHPLALAFFFISLY